MWSWTKMTGALSVLNDSMWALQRELTDSAKYLPSQFVKRTADATVTTLATIAIPANMVVKVRGQVVGRRTGGSSGAANDGAGYTVDFVATNTAGTAAAIGAAIPTVIGESQAAWACTVAFSGGNALVKVAGAANNNVTWIWSGQTLTVED